MKPKHTNLPARFTALILLYYSAAGCYLPYIVAFMANQGLKTSEIGLIVMTNAIVSVVMQPVWGMICDKIGSVRKVMCCLLAVLVAAAPITTFLPKELYKLWVPFVLTLLFCSLNAVCDTWLVAALRQMPGRTYGSFRLWGSVGYFASSFAMGYLSDMFSMKAVFYCFAGLSAITMLIGRGIPVEGVDPSGASARVSIRNIPVKKLLGNPDYSVFVFSALILFIPMSLKNNFFVQRFYAAGGSDTLYGVSQALAALSEVPVFFYSAGLIKKLGPAKALRMSMFAQAMQIAFLAFRLPIPAIMAVQLTHGFGYGLFQASAISYIDATSEPGMKASAMTLANAVYGNLGMMIGSSVSGMLIDRIGVLRVYFYGSFIAVFSVLMFTVLIAVRKRKGTKL